MLALSNQAPGSELKILIIIKIVQQKHPIVIFLQLYLNSIKSYFYNDDTFNFNYGQAKASVGEIRLVDNPGLP